MSGHAHAEPPLADPQLAVHGAGAVDTTDPERRYRDLFDARSVIGAVAVLVVLSFFGFGLRAIDESQKSAGFEVGSRYQATETVSFAPVDGWSIDKENTLAGAVVTLTNNGATMKLEQLEVQPNQTLEDLAKIFQDGDKQSDQYQHVTEFAPVTTAIGLHGITWSATGPTDATQSWMILGDDGKSVAYMPASGPVSSWASVQDGLDAMAASIAVKVPSKEQSS